MSKSKQKSDNDSLAAAAAAKESEEAFLTLLQRIQRQASSSPPSTQILRPPDEASAAMGRQLALKFATLAVPPATADPVEQTSQQILPVIPKALQEKALQCLLQRHLNPSIVETFLQTLVPGGKLTPLVQCEWLPTWILQAELALLEQSPSDFHALNTMIRTYAHYQWWWHQQDLHHQWTRAIQRGMGKHATTVKPARSSHDPLQVATTYQRLQSATARKRMIQECIQTAFSSGQAILQQTTTVTHNDNTTTTMVHAALGMANSGQMSHASSAVVGAATSLDDGGGGDGASTIIGGNSSVASGSVTTASTSRQQQPQIRRHRPLLGGVSPRKLVQAMLSPLLSASVLTFGAPIQESMLFLELLWRDCWSEMTAWIENENVGATEAQQDYFHALEWLTHALDLFLWGLPCHSNSGGNAKSQWAAMEHLTASKELATRWLLQLLELASFLVQTFAEDEDDDELFPSIPVDPALAQAVGQWLSRIASETVPRLFAVVPSYPVSLSACWIQILQLLQRLSSNPAILPQNNNIEAPDTHSAKPLSSQLEFLDTVAILKLATVVLSNPIPSEVQVMLQILHVAMSSSTTRVVSTTHPGSTKSTTTTASVTTLAMLRGLASMFSRKDGCQQTSQALIQTLKAQSNSSRKSTSNTMKKIKATRSSFGVVNNVIQFLDNSIVDVENFVMFLSKENALVGTKFTAMQQTASLLFGIALLMDDPKHQTAAYTFLGHLLQVYPHLGISLLPVLVDCINAACVKGDATTFQRQLEFLCESVVQDTQCAREIWNLIGVQLMTPTTPAVIRTSMIRLFPKLCLANKRLYKRVMEALGNNLATSAHNVEIKLAVAATIADLAKEDRIRDVTDVIGWIQGFITEISWIRPVSTLDEEKSGSNAALVHYAVLALHYLLLAQELDFDLVIAVLNKRLCNVHDMKEVLMLPPLVLESLALLLGDGECEEEDDDEEDDKEERQLQPVGVSSQVSKSVETLIQLALSPKLHAKRANQDVLLKGTLLRCRKNIQQSLAAYSTDALGIDDVGLKAIVAAANNEEAPSPPSSGRRYESVRQIVEDGIRLLESGSYKMNPVGASWGKDARYTPDGVSASDISPSLGALICKSLKFEEDILGSTLWQKRGSRKGQTAKKKVFVQGQVSPDPGQVQALPSSASVQKVYNENRCTATSLAVLLCFEGKPLSFFGDLAADIAHESSDPFLLAFTVQAWLNAARATLMELVMSFSSSEGLENVLMEVREWRFRLDSPDNMFLALASLALMIPDILGPYGDHSPYVDEICDEVWSGYRDNDIENEDIGKLCIGFVGVCAMRSSSDDLLGEIVDNLERSVMGYGGKASFGAYYGLAIIAQSCQHAIEGKEDDDERSQFIISLVSRIVGFLVNELVLCIAGKHNALASLVGAIKDGEISPEIIDTITALGKKPIKMVKAKTEATKSLFLSLAICVPALSVVNDELLLGVYCFLEAIPWGHGKGMALSSVLQSCRRSGLFKNREVEKIYSKYGKIFEEGMDKGVSGLDDIFYAVTATMTKSIPYSIRRFLVGNRTLFDEDGRAVSLLAAVVSLSSMPCLGCGALAFTETAQLSPQASSEDIDGVATLISEAVVNREWTKYPQIGIILMGFLASMNNFADTSDNSVQSQSSLLISKSQPIDAKLPTAQPGTVLEVVMDSLSQLFDQSPSNFDEASSNAVVQLLGCLEVLSLPGHFASFLEQMFRGTDEIKTACTRLLISQIRGRPRAVFDGRDYVDLALKMSKMPPTAIKTMLGQGGAPILFVEALVDLVPKFSTDSVGEVVENFWRLCFNQASTLPGMSVAFLKAMKALVRGAHSGDKKSLMTSPKTLSFLRNFLVTRAFAGIRDAPWTASTSSSTIEERTIVEAYSQCLLEIPVSTLVDAEFFTLKELDGFVGEALRYRCVMELVRNEYFNSPARSSSEISSAIAWFSRQLTSSEEEIFSSTLLQVACSIADATSSEDSERRKEHLLTLLDNLLLTGPSASYVGLQMLGVLVCRWVDGEGSDGDLSLVCLISKRMERWKELSPPTLQQTFRILVHDLPYNLATYARVEKVTGVVFNRLWRIYNKWFEQGADRETIECVRRALVCCRGADSGSEEFASLATSMLS